jgi:hypothetical protein
MERHDGFLPIYFDGAQDYILMEIPKDSMRALLMPFRDGASDRIRLGSTARAARSWESGRRLTSS